MNNWQPLYTMCLIICWDCSVILRGLWLHENIHEWTCYTGGILSRYQGGIHSWEWPILSLMFAEAVCIHTCLIFIFYLCRFRHVSRSAPFRNKCCSSLFTKLKICSIKDELESMQRSKWKKKCLRHNSIINDELTHIHPLLRIWYLTEFCYL